MKYIILIGDGMGDYPIPELNGKTPLQAAATPHMDKLASLGELGLARTIPVGMEPGSDIANLAIMGYDPAKYHTGRAPLEAAALGVALKPNEVAFRCNLVTLKAEAGGFYMEDYAAGHITSEEAKVLIQALEAELGANGRHFYPGVSYRHLLVWDQGDAGWKTYPPHDWSGQEVGHLMTPYGGREPLWGLVVASWRVLQTHDLNMRRRVEGKKPANSIWLWGQGKPPQLPTLKERFNLTGAVISAVDLIRGIGLYAGLTPIKVPGATGYLDTNYEGKVAAALTALNTMDFVFIHVEAPDEASHKGELKLKIQAIEDFDRRVVGPLMEGLPKLGDHRLLVMCDHLTSIALKTHTPEPVPFVLYDSRQANDAQRGYTEADAAAGGLVLEQGAELLPRLLERG